ncbi:MAG: DNA internalization-related competence protein ComEC/Rec2 [Eubacteriales bacterium]|nr:DNA internalization-related competence protein ComEC/Rec2 [Eubacteriales bacterium]
MKGRYLCYICLPLFLWFAAAGIFHKDAVEWAASLPITEGQTVYVSGTVYRQEFKSSYQSIYLKNISLISEPETQPESDAADILPKISKTDQWNILVYLKKKENLCLGANVLVCAEVSFLRPASNPGGFDQKDYYESKKIGMILRRGLIKKKDRSIWPVRSMIDKLHQKCVEEIYCLADSENAGILSAMLMGDRSGLETRIRDLYQDMGLIHLFSVSGLHVTMLGMGLYRILRKAGMPIKGAAGICAVVMMAYAFMTGMAFPAVRAVIMFVIYLLSILTGRTYDLPTALAVAAVTILYGHSGAVTQAGFLMSFAAVAGVVLAGQWKTKKLQNSAAGSNLGIQIMTLPLTSFFYYKIPIYSLGINLLVIPIMPAVLGFGIAGMAAGIVCRPVGKIVIAPALYILKAVKFSCEKVRWLPFSSVVTGKPYFLVLICYYIFLLAGFIVIGRNMQDSRKADAVKLSFAIILLSGTLGFSSAKKFEMIFLDVGQGDGCCIENCGKSVWVIDGGSSTESSLAAYCLEPFLESRKIDRVDFWMISHYDIDHISGLLEILENYERNMTGKNMNGISIGRILLPDIGDDGEMHGLICEYAEKQRIPVFYIHNGDVLRDNDMTISILSPDKGREYSTENAASVVAEVSYFEFSALLTGDLEKDGESGLLENYSKLDVDVLKVAHHGSEYATSEEFLESVLPEAAVISCGRNNRYGHPGDGLIQRLDKFGCFITRTDMQGAVTIQTDGENWKIRTQAELAG